MENKTGYRSTGDWSTGDRSTGDRSTGDGSTGNWSISNYSAGHFSTIDYTGFGAFNKHCSIEEWNNAKKPKFIYFNLTEWVPEEDMSDQDKEYFGRHKTTGGCLKVYTYKEAWAKAWNEATDEDRKLLHKLPNFDADVFMAISGIDVKANSAMAEYVTQRSEGATATTPILPNTDEQGEGEEEAFEVVEYEKAEFFLSTSCPNGTQSNMTDEQIKRFERHYTDRLVKVGSASCREDCKHFRGHHVEGESIRCSAKKDGG